MTQAERKLLKELGKEGVYIRTLDSGGYEMVGTKLGFAFKTMEAVIATGLLVKMGRFFVSKRKIAERKKNV